MLSQLWPGGNRAAGGGRASGHVPRAAGSRFDHPARLRLSPLRTRVERLSGCGSAERASDRLGSTKTRHSADFRNPARLNPQASCRARVSSEFGNPAEHSQPGPSVTSTGRPIAWWPGPASSAASVSQVSTSGKLRWLPDAAVSFELLGNDPPHSNQQSARNSQGDLPQTVDLWRKPESLEEIRGIQSPSAVGRPGGEGRFLCRQSSSTGEISGRQSPASS